MKLRNLYFAMAAGLAFTACSSDEPANSGNETNGDFNYVSVRICTPGEMGSRYTDNNKDYDKGTEGESKVTNAMFVFFGANGNISEIVKDVEFQTWKDGNGETIDKETKAVATLTGSSVKPVSVIAILNPPAGIEDDIRQKGSVNAVRQILGNYTNTADGKFMMTNSAYRVGNEDIYAAKITGEIFATKEAALAAEENTVDIYVERVLSKVTVSKSTDFANPSTNLEFVNGLDSKDDAVAVVPVIKGYKLTNVTGQATIVKRIDGVTQDWEWNDPANHRSYWATVPNQNVELFNWNEISTSNPTGEFTQYPCPNNMDSSLPLQAGHTSKATKIVVAAELQVNDKPLDLIRYLDNYYKSEEDFLTRIAYEFATAGVKWAKDETVDDGVDHKTGTYGADDLEIVRYTDANDKVHPYKVIAKIKASALTDKPLADAAIYNEFVNNLRPAIEWKNGLTYYFAEIKHIGFEGQTAELAALIRNHVYKVTLDGITGLGTPVYEPTEDIDPERPTDEPDTYVSARIALLKWRVVGQHLTLE
ncbi:MAG: Mfa1 family fimbria major subunit [Duncaniella sp.]|nr:Mfa1 family fimbria major subunit [Duncaniella sp.]